MNRVYYTFGVDKENTTDFAFPINPLGTVVQISFDCILVTCLLCVNDFVQMSILADFTACCRDISDFE